jgi:hypothetical protein
MRRLREEDRRIILKCIFTTWDGVMDWTDLAQNRSSCECGNEHSAYIKCGKIFD